MKRKVIKERGAPNVLLRYYCPCDMVAVKNYAICDILGFPDGFKFCPLCGAELNYEESEADNG